MLSVFGVGIECASDARIRREQETVLASDAPTCL